MISKGDDGSVGQEVAGHDVLGAEEGIMLGAFRLTPTFSPRVWGKQSLAPWYSETGTTELVGEAWLTGPEAVVSSGPMLGRTLQEAVAEEARTLLGTAAAENGASEFPLLVKILFPNDKLSVQVHPDDLQAQAIGQPRGKTECWYVLEAEPGAAVALGLTNGVTLDAVRSAIGDGTLEALLTMVPVSVGDMVFVDAGTVHAIGPGVVLLETQQTSDTTYRMFDYGRPRPLHVEQGLGVTKLMTRAGKVAPQQRDGFIRLIEEKYFAVDRFAGPAVVTMVGPGCLVGLSAGITVFENGATIDLSAGQAVVVPAGCTVTVDAPKDGTYLRCMAPAL